MTLNSEFEKYPKEFKERQFPSYTYSPSTPVIIDKNQAGTSPSSSFPAVVSSTYNTSMPRIIKFYNNADISLYLKAMHFNNELLNRYDVKTFVIYIENKEGRHILLCPKPQFIINNIPNEYLSVIKEIHETIINRIKLTPDLMKRINKAYRQLQKEKKLDINYE